MAKRISAFELVLPPRDSGQSAGNWLYGALRGEILEGRLRPGSRLPASRDLAKQYGLSRGTIVSAFDHLKSEGYVDGNVGSGTYVSEILPEELLQASRDAASKAAAAPRPQRRLSDYARALRTLPNFSLRPSRAFRANAPALDLFPTALWAQVAARRLRRVTTNMLLVCEPLGYPPLRRAVADYLNASRGVQCMPEQVAIVSGVQEALDLVARLFLRPGDRACVENPGYTGATILFAAVGAKILAVPLDNEGMQLDAARLRGARIVYVTPGHQFPMGITMSLTRRLQLLAWARESGALIFEDDYDSEFRYAGRPVPALQGLDRHGQVLFTGSFSKVLFPSLRLGYLVVPPDLVDRVSAAISVTSRHAPLLEQAILCDFIAEGHFGRHLRRMRKIYAERAATLFECAREELNGLLEICKVEAGLQTAGLLCAGLDGTSAAGAAAQRDVEVIALSRFQHGGKAPEGLQLGFASVDAKEIRRGARELAIALEGAVKSSRRSSNGTRRS